MTLAARGPELQALQTELARHMPNAVVGDANSLSYVITLQRRILALLDELQAGARPQPVPPRERHGDGIVTMRPSGQAGETLWVVDPTTAPIQRAAAPMPPAAPVAPPRQVTQPKRPAKADDAARPPRRNPPRPHDERPAAPPPAGDQPQGWRAALLAPLKRHAGLGMQALAAAFVVVAMVVTTASLMRPIATKLGLVAKPSAESQNRPKPAARLSQPPGTNVAALVEPRPTPVFAPPAAPPAGPAYVTVIATHATFAAARQAFVTLKGLYPGPLASTVPDIRTIKGPDFKNVFELALLPTLPRADADDLCRRLKSLGHATCIVKRQP